MKRIIIIFIGILLCLFISVCLMVSFDKKYINNLEKNILDNTELKDVIYVNKYDDNYIVSDLEYIYLFNSKYEEIYRVELYLLHENNNDYDIIYRNDLMMYMDSYKNKKGVIFKYYDIYTYELIEEVVVGGN